jgi:hypothetical protein
MKKLFALMLVVTGLVIAGCAKTDDTTPADTNDTTPPVNEPADPADPATPPADDPAN